MVTRVVSHWRILVAINFGEKYKENIARIIAAKEETELKKGDILQWETVSHWRICGQTGGMFGSAWGS